MKRIKEISCLVLLVLLFNSLSGFSQNEQSRDSLNKKLMKAAREIMNSVPNCALITLDQEGGARVGEMDPFPPEDDFTVWFGTNPLSRKVNQIKNDPRVTLYYANTDGSGYVMMYGIARIVDDKNEREKRWKIEWEAFYPNKPEDYLLIKVIPEWLEVVSYAHGIAGDPATWEPPTVIFGSK